MSTETKLAASGATISIIHPAENISRVSGSSHHSLRRSVEIALKAYFAQLDGQPTSDLYALVMTEVEPPLLEAVMNYTRQNQSKAAEMLGLNRGTLRKKLKQYELL